MDYSIPYPQTVELEDGAMIQITEDVWKDRQLVVETDRSEAEVRGIFAEEGFRQAGMEFVKKGQIGVGMVKRVNDWQIHFRLYRRGTHIQIDGEIEISSAYFEHLNHGWIPALTNGADIIERHFGAARLYHKGRRKYVTKIIKRSILKIADLKIKTSVAVVGSIVGTLIAVGLVVWALKRQK